MKNQILKNSFIFVKILFLGAILFSAISFIAFAFETLTITKGLRESDEILKFGFPLKIFEQFWVEDCQNQIRGWFPKNIIVNYFFAAFLSFLYFITKSFKSIEN
jgi:hypothetical protein